MHAEIGGVARTNVLHNQLQTGQIEVTNIFSTIKDSGAVDINIEGDQQSDDNDIEAQVGGCQDIEYDNKECHKGTQTELRAFWDITDHRRKLKPPENLCELK